MSEQTNTENLLSIKDAATRLHVSIQTVERLLKEKKLASYKVAGRILISEQNHLKPFLKQCERAAQV